MARAVGAGGLWPVCGLFLGVRGLLLLGCSVPTTAKKKKGQGLKHKGLVGKSRFGGLLGCSSLTTAKKKKGQGIKNQGLVVKSRFGGLLGCSAPTTAKKTTKTDDIN